MSGLAEVRRVKRDDVYVWQLRCPTCSRWGDVDDDQLHGRVSIHHDVADCGFHETLDLSRHPLVAQIDEYDALSGEWRRGR